MQIYFWVLFKILDLSLSDKNPKFWLWSIEELLKSLRSKGSAVDHVIPLASVFRDAPGYTEAGQVIDFNINKKKGNTLDADFGKAFKKVLKGDFSSVENYNKKALDFASANNVLEYAETSL